MHSALHNTSGSWRSKLRNTQPQTYLVHPPQTHMRLQKRPQMTIFNKSIEPTSLAHRNSQWTLKNRMRICIFKSMNIVFDEKNTPSIILTNKCVIILSNRIIMIRTSLKLVKFLILRELTSSFRKCYDNLSERTYEPRSFNPHMFDTFDRVILNEFRNILLDYIWISMSNWKEIMYCSLLMWWVYANNNIVLNFKS